MVKQVPASWGLLSTGLSCIWHILLAVFVLSHDWPWTFRNANCCVGLGRVGVCNIIYASTRTSRWTWNSKTLQLTSRLNTPPPVFSPSSILSPFLSDCPFIPPRTNSAHFSEVLLLPSSVFFNCVRLKFRSLKEFPLNRWVRLHHASWSISK